MAICRADFWSFIIELVARNPTMGLPALEDGLFVNLLIFDYLCMYIQKSRVPRLIPSLGRLAASLAFCALDVAFQMHFRCV